MIEYPTGKETAKGAPEHVIGAFGFAAGLWPSAFEPTSEAVWITWGSALERYSYEELCEAFRVLALRGPFPKQHQLIAWLRDEFPKSAEPKRFAKPGSNTEDRWRTEAIAFCKDRPDGVERLVKLSAEIDAACEGPFTRRMQGLITKTDTRSTGEFLTSMFPGSAQTGRPVSMAEALGASPETAEDLAVRLCDRREAGETIDAAALDPGVRAAARAEWIRRHPQGDAGATQ